MVKNNTTTLEKMLKDNRARVSSDLDAVTKQLLVLEDIQSRYQILKGTPAFNHKHQELLERISTFVLQVFQVSHAFNSLSTLSIMGVTILEGAQELEADEEAKRNQAGR